MKVAEFDFTLPEERIALHPVEPRDAARMLVVRPGQRPEDRVVRDLPALLNMGDVLVLNDTRVLPAELHATRLRDEQRAAVSLNLHKRVDGSTWRAFARPAKRLRVGDALTFSEAPGEVCYIDVLTARVAEMGEGGEVTLSFELAGAYLDEAIKAHGIMPLPPYIGLRRSVEERDKIDYQTVYARQEGAVAAPTAGLHFTDDLLAKLAARGVQIERVTLHVGAGTFLPMKVDDTDDHRMHSEWGELDAQTAERIVEAKAAGKRIVAVGTTSLRLLEAAALSGSLTPISGDTDIFITPGFKFGVVDALMTNFHLPRSTLFVLVSAFSGLETMRAAYAHAIASGYRFYSYGDATLLFRAKPGE